MEDRPSVPRMRAEWKPRHRIMAYAARMRVFTVDDVMRDLNAATAHGIDEAFAKGDIVRHAPEVYSLHCVDRRDPRVLEAIARTRGKADPLADVIARAAVAEEREARRLESQLPMQSAEDRIDKFLKRNPVFLKSTMRTAALGQTDAILRKLLADDRIHQIDQLYLAAYVEINDQAVDDFLKAQGEEAVTIVTEIEDALKVAPSSPRIEYRLEKRNWTDPDGAVHRRQSRLHMLVPGCPPIYGVVRGSNREVGIDWHSKVVSRLTAETIARKVLSPMPRTMGELLGDIDRGAAPISIVRRNTGLPVAPARDEGGSPWPTPAARRVPIPARTILTIDTSEDDAVLSALTGTPNVHVVRARLAVGDYHFRSGARQITIERKTVRDLAASFDDGRLARQMPLLAAMRHPTFVLIEGDMHGTDVLPPAKLARVQTRLAALGIGFLSTRDHAGTAYALATLARDVLHADHVEMATAA